MPDKHFFKLEGEELQQLKKAYPQFEENLKFAAGKGTLRLQSGDKLVLITLRGSKNDPPYKLAMN
ncbi:MAG: hypothetical protein P4L49_16560 [Desulfosporosinus sp.]|nr:hypothetical protein [Desulfosporosinus sp.]